MSFKLITVGIADLKIASSPDILRTILGSCVGICLYDTEKKIAGLSHIMLPRKSEFSDNMHKYADSSIPLLISEMEKAGAQSQKLEAKIVGGATMFKLAENGYMSEIGKNNIKMVKEILSDLNINIIAEDLGGDFGRTIDFYAEDGQLKVKSRGRFVRII